MSGSGEARTLTFADFLALGVNGVVGSGVYLLLGPMAAKAGAASVLGTVLCAGMCLLVALCFAELSSMFREDGGAYVYGRAAFGKTAGFVIGWMSLVEGVVAFAAVAVGFGGALGELIPALGNRKSAAAVVVILLFSALNYRGVKTGARSVDVLSLLKVAPLLLLAVVGLGHLSPALIPAVTRDAHSLRGLGGATFLAAFMLSGFEYTAVPAGAAKHPERAIPRALVASLLIATALYVVLQLVLLSLVPDLAQNTAPLTALATGLFGPRGGQVMALSAVVSMAGFCAGSALVGPRYVTALASGGYLPMRLAGWSRFGTPGSGILVSAVAASALAIFVDFDSLVDLGTLALFAQYLPASLAVPVLRHRRPEMPREVRVPGGPYVIPTLAASASVALLWVSHPRWAEWRLTVGVIAAGAVLWGLSHRWNERGQNTGR